jgi:hypothetical protein
MRRLALLLALVVLAGCAGSSETTPNPNPACDKKWNTLISMGRCLFGVQPPQDPPPRAAPQSAPSTPPTSPETTPEAIPSPPASTPPASKESAPAS